MTSSQVEPLGAGASQAYGSGPGSREPANPGDIRVNLLDIELLTIKLRLVIASLDTAKQVGINWWESDPWLSADATRGTADRELARENRQLRARVRALEANGGYDEDEPDNDDERDD
jgi:hypothetical protein